MVKDPVHHPSHYTHTAIEPLDVIEAWAATWPPEIAPHLSNVIKYTGRCGLKGKLVEDLQKMVRYAQRAVAIMERKEKSSSVQAPAQETQEIPYREGGAHASSDTKRSLDLIAGDYVEITEVADGQSKSAIGRRGSILTLPSKADPKYTISVLDAEVPNDRVTARGVRVVPGWARPMERGGK